MKSFFRVIHLYLSLAAGIVIAIVCFTGAVLVFEKELVQTIYPERFFVEAGDERLPIAQLMQAVQVAKPKAKISGVKIYQDPTRTMEINFSESDGKSGKAGESAKEVPRGKNKENTAAAGEHKKGDGKGEKKGGPGKGGRGDIAYLNPYTGQLIATSAQKSPFFMTMFGLHRWLLVQDGPGKLIVGVSTVFFLFILITGIVLWWPKNKKILQQRLSLKFDAGWKRINHDLHIVVGFYTAVFLFAFAFTGLAWSFEWFNDGIYKLTNSEKTPLELPLSQVRENAPAISFDQALAVAQNKAPRAEFYSLSSPQEPDAAITVNFMPEDAVHERANAQLYLDQYSGEVLGQSLFEDKNLGQRVRSTFYPVHVGSIAGLPGRIIAFISCVAGFTFPITGIILWLNRLKKNRKKKQKKFVAQRA
ncbi:MAG: hypothetical protein COW65_16745 [Cytophagales bacterium CG18_big_fil_WC_8_21_14_2_50_42_9]|nr:MAG: hypothetical protein COW65_16745 [Cytophagales bacterium CG18_big_fil_WC_8_21_14_2_50_42_9]